MQRSLKPSPVVPPDFERFWRRTQDELATVPLELNTAPESGAPAGCRLQRIRFRSLGGTPIGGYALLWQDAQSRPLVVHSHGYGDHEGVTVQRAWASHGLHVVGVDLRGFGRSQAALPRRSRWGYVLTGISAPERSVLRGAVCDYLRTVHVARTLVPAPPARTILYGFSFSGAVALMAEAVGRVADLLVTGVPTLGWAEGRQFFVRSGSGLEISQYLERRPEAAEDLLLVLRYFDPMNFARLIQCPALIGVGLRDDVVPARTVYAIANHMEAPHEVMEFPVSHTTLPEERLWEAFEARWLSLALDGVPPGFGDPGRLRSHDP
jgi:cephalosporin-C deacetylase